MAENSNLVMRLFRLLEHGPEEVERPSFSMVVDAVRGLDGNLSDLMSIKLRNGNRMDVGGGKDDQFKCHASINHQLFHLINPRCARDMKDSLTIMMGEEGCSFPKCTIVSLELVMASLEYFFMRGELNPTLTWDHTLQFDPL